jgi:rubrerythrin
MKSIEHLGQVKMPLWKLAARSVFSIMKIMKSNQDCQFYLLFKLKVKQSQQKVYSCTFCGNTESHKPGNALCNVCAKSEWVESIKHFENLVQSNESQYDLITI